MSYTAWMNPDFKGLNDNIIAAIAAGSTGGYPVGSTLTTYAISGADQVELQNNINAALLLLAVKVFSISAPAVDPADISKTFVLITVIT